MNPARFAQQRHKNLENLEDCRRAHLELQQIFNTIERQIRYLVEITKSPADDLQMMLEEMQRLVLDGSISWEFTDIVADLRAAEADLGSNGWTPLSEIGPWMAKNRPEQSSANYSCASWQQVLHDSKLFELKRMGREGRFYRSRPERSSECADYTALSKSRVLKNMGDRG